MTERQVSSFTEPRTQPKYCKTSGRERHNVYNSKYVQHISLTEANGSSARRYPQSEQQEGSLRCLEERCNTKKHAGWLTAVRTR